MNKINFILPGFLNVSRNEILINIYENYPYITMDNSCIHSFYGNFPSCIWNGGRLCLGERYSAKQMKKIRDFHNKRGIAIALTMSNLVLQEKHLDDAYSNSIMKIFNNGKNEVLISSMILEKYIRDNYKNYKYNRSITSTQDKGYYPEDYNLTVLAVRYTNDFDYINKIPLNKRHKIEILCNEPCFDSCKYKYIHYEELNHDQIGDAPTFENRHSLYGKCRYSLIRNVGYFYHLSQKQSFFVSPKDIVNKYLPLGINHFKINGREKNKYQGYENIIQYVIRESYQNDVLTYMLERLFLEYEKEVRESKKKYGTFAEEDEIGLHELIKEKNT